MTTWTKQDGTQRVSIYHSYLAKKQGLVIRFTGEPRDGRDGGRIVPFEVNGDPQPKAYWLLIENDEVEDAIQRAPQDEWVTVEAGGSRDEAYLSIGKAQGVQQDLPKTQATSSNGKVDFTREPYPYPSVQAAYDVAHVAAYELLQEQFLAGEVETDMEHVRVMENVRELAASMLYRQHSLFQQYGKWVPLSAADDQAKRGPEGAPEGFATLEQAAELANLYQQLQDKIPEGPEKSGVEKTIGKREQATRAAVEKCIGYLKGWSGAWDHLGALTDEEASTFDAENLEDELPF